MLNKRKKLLARYIDLASAPDATYWSVQPQA